MADKRKSIFDAIRAAKGAGLTQAQVNDVNAVLDKIGVPKDGGMLGSNGEALIKKWESYAKDLGDGRVQAYPDPATGGAPWTIGWGSTGPDITKGTIWTRAQAEKRFQDHAQEFANGVTDALGSAPTTQNQFDAMTSLAYNIGLGNFKSSTLLKKHKAGDYAGAKAQFAVWKNANGKVMQGLVNRRAEEAELYGS